MAEGEWLRLSPSSVGGPHGVVRALRPRCGTAVGGGQRGAAPRATLAIEQRHAEVDGVRIYYQVAGDGEPLVLLHGLSGSGRWWARTFPALAQRHRVYVLDLVGFGRSRGAHRFVLHEAAQHLTAWMDAVGVQRTHVVGHSMGGFIAAALAAEAPERMMRLVLVDAAVLPFERGYARQVVRLGRALRHLPLGFLVVLVTDAWRAGPITILRAAYELLTTNVRPELARIEAPTLVVWGEEDSLIPLHLGQRLSESVPGAQLRVLPGCGHVPMWEGAEAFTRTVLEFLDADATPAQRIHH